MPTGRWTTRRWQSLSMMGLSQRSAKAVFVVDEKLMAFNAAKGIVLSEGVEVADSFFQRLVGLMGRGSLEKGCGLLIYPCRSIHTFFMRFSIDAVFLDEKGTVINVEEFVRPFAVRRGPRGAVGVLELPAGTVGVSQLSSGDIIRFRTSGDREFTSRVSLKRQSRKGRFRGLYQWP